MSLLNGQDTMCTAVGPTNYCEPMPSPVEPESPSEHIHNKLLNLRDRLDGVSSQIGDKLSPVMKNHPIPPQSNEERGNSGMPPLFEQYSELIGHIELVVDDINFKLNHVDI